MRNSKGFTLIEIVIVVGILSILIGFTTINFVGIQSKTSITGVSDVLASDISSQQTKAMSGAGTTSASDYGIYFEQGKYTLFKGTIYNPLDSNNYVVSMDNGYTITDSFPSDTLLFASISGQVKNYVDGQSSVAIVKASGTEAMTITLNRYGVVVSQE